MAASLSKQAYETLLENRRAANGDAGVSWVNTLLSLIGLVADRWNVTIEPHFENLSYNYVATVRREDGTPAVLKLCPPDDDFICEAEAVRAFDGDGCVRLLGLDREAGAMLIERVEPGVEVHKLQDDVAETSAVADVMRALQRPYNGAFPFPHASEWIDAALDPKAIPGLKARFGWIQRSLDRLAEMAIEPGEDLLLHGDLHHDNVLSATRARWLAIDPKGVIGDPAWEIAPFLFNRLLRYPRTEWPRIIRRRADQFAEELGLDRQRVYAWSAVRAVQSAFWSLRDDPSYSGPIFEGSIVCAQVLSE